MQRPHYVFRNRPYRSQIEYWTGTGWDPEYVKAKPINWYVGLELITVYRSDAGMQHFGFGMTPASML